MFRHTFHLYLNAFKGLTREIWILSLVMFINRAGLMVIPFLSLYLTKGLDFSLAQAGWVMTAFGSGSLGGSYLGGRLTDRFGHYWVQFWSLILAGGMFFLLMQMQSFVALCVTIFFTSLIADAYRPAGMAAITEFSRPENRARSITLVRLAINLGISIGPAMGGFLAGSVGYGALFVVDGLTCLLAAVVLWRFLPRDTEEALGNEAEEAQARAVAARPVWKDRDFVLFLLLQLLTIIAFFQLLVTVPIYGKDTFGLHEADIGLLLTLNGLLIVLIEMPLIQWLERHARPLQLTALGAAIICLSFLLLAMPLSGTWVMVLFIIGLTFGEMINFPFSNTYAMGLSNRLNRGRYMGLYTMMFSLAHILSPIIGTQLVGWYGFGVMYGVMALIAALAMVGFLRLRPAKLPATPAEKLA